MIRLLARCTYWIYCNLKYNSSLPINWNLSGYYSKKCWPAKCLMRRPVRELLTIRTELHTCTCGLEGTLLDEFWGNSTGWLWMELYWTFPKYFHTLLDTIFSFLALQIWHGSLYQYLLFVSCIKRHHLAQCQSIFWKIIDASSKTTWHVHVSHYRVDTSKSYIKFNNECGKIQENEYILSQN
jgi:hypothetical protein